MKQYKIKQESPDTVGVPALLQRYTQVVRKASKVANQKGRGSIYCHCQQQCSSFPYSRLEGSV